MGRGCSSPGQGCLGLLRVSVLLQALPGEGAIGEASWATFGTVLLMLASTKSRASHVQTHELYHRGMSQSFHTFNMIFKILCVCTCGSVCVHVGMWVCSGECR